MLNLENKIRVNYFEKIIITNLSEIGIFSINVRLFDASNGFRFYGFPVLVTLWFGFTIVIIGLIIVSILLLSPTKKPRENFTFFCLAGFLILPNMPFLLLDIWHIFALLGFKEHYGSSFSVSETILAISFYILYGASIALLVYFLYRLWYGKSFKK